MPETAQYSLLHAALESVSTPRGSLGGTNSSTNGIKRKYPILIIDTHLINH